MSSVALPARDRAILRSFADRIDAYDPGAANNLGVLYFTRGMVDEAVAMFTRALELDARMTIAQRNLEIAYFTSGFYDRRVRELTDRLEASPGDRYARWELGRTCLLLGDVPRALAAFGELLREDPDDVQVIRQVATAEARCGDLEAAARWLDHALAVAPDNPAVLFQRGEVAYHRGLNEVARQALERSVQLAPDDADAWYLLGFVRGDVGDAEGAAGATQRALRLNPSLGHARTNLSLEKFDPRSWQKATEARTSRGIGTTPAEDAMPHYHLGLAFRQKGYLAEALKEYRIALDRGEDSDVVGQAIAEVHLMRGEMPQAVAQYDVLLANAPHRARYWNGRGIALHHQGKYAEALVSYAKAVAADGAHVAAHNNLGVAAFHAGDFARAQAELEAAIALDAGHVRAWLNLALLRLRQDAFAPALHAYRQVLLAVPEHPVAWNGVGLVLTRLRRFADARSAFSRAIEARPGYAEAHYNLGFTLSNLGEYDAALRETRRALEIDPYYTAQKFELAVDLEHEDPRFDIAPEVTGTTTTATQQVAEFAFEPTAIEALFAELEPAVAAPPTQVDPWQGARTHLASGAWDAARAEIRRAIAGGAPLAEGLILQGEAWLSQGMAGEALERFREAARHAPHDADALSGEVRSLVRLQRHEEALPLLERLPAVASMGAALQLAVATVRAETGDVEAACTHLREALAAAPGRAELMAAMGRMERRAGRPSHAIASFRAALSADQGLVDERVELAELLSATGEVTQAEHELVGALDTDPDHASACRALARLRLGQGRARAAIPDLATFLLRHPWQLDVLATLGEALLRVTAWDDAEFAVRRVLRFDPDHASGLYVDGSLCLVRHDYRGAIAAWQRVIAVEPSSEEARRARRDLRIAEELQRTVVQPVLAEVR